MDLASSPPGTLPADHRPSPAAAVERAVLASIVDGVLVNDVTERVTLLNEAAAQFLQIERRTAVGRPVRTLFDSFSARGRLTLEGAMDRLFADPYSAQYAEGITETIVEIGARVIQAHLSPVLTEVGEFLGLVTVLRDVTREVESERAKTDFVSNVSHELRTPLTAIKGYTDLVIRQAAGPLNEQQMNFLQVVQTNADRLTTLINELLDISRIESGRVKLDTQTVFLQGTIETAVEMVRPYCDQRRQQMVVELDPEAGPVLGDENRLVQVVGNLLSNASRYTPEDGRIKVSLSQLEGFVRVDVSDTGIGISPEDQAKIFQRFYRSEHPAVQLVAGTGLGLSITKMLVEMHAGRVWVESEPGHGSTFTVVLPVHAGTAEVGPQISPRQRVLVVEDNREIAEQIALQLRGEGFDALVALTGAQALTLARAERVDLVTLDMLLPDLTGMEVLRQLKADPETASVPVIVVSVMSPPAPGQGGSAGGYGERSFALEKFVESVREALAR